MTSSVKIISKTESNVNVDENEDEDKDEDELSFGLGVLLILDMSDCVRTVSQIFANVSCKFSQFDWQLTNFE